MDDETVRALILDHDSAAGVDEVHVAQAYADDAILDFRNAPSGFAARQES